MNQTVPSEISVAVKEQQTKLALWCNFELHIRKETHGCLDLRVPGMAINTPPGC